MNALSQHSIRIVISRAKTTFEPSQTLVSLGAFHQDVTGPKSDPTENSDSSADGDVVGAFDSIDGTAAFVVSDTESADAWLAMPTETTRDIEQFR
jgi:hypothetical protein